MTRCRSRPGSTDRRPPRARRRRRRGRPRRQPKRAATHARVRRRPRPVLRAAVGRRGPKARRRDVAGPGSTRRLAHGRRHRRRLALPGPAPRAAIVGRRLLSTARKAAWPRRQRVRGRVAVPGGRSAGARATRRSTAVAHQREGCRRVGRPAGVCAARFRGARTGCAGAWEQRPRSCRKVGGRLPVRRGRATGRAGGVTGARSARRTSTRPCQAACHRARSILRQDRSWQGRSRGGLPSGSDATCAALRWGRISGATLDRGVHLGVGNDGVASAAIRCQGLHHLAARPQPTRSADLSEVLVEELIDLRPIAASRRCQQTLSRVMICSVSSTSCILARLATSGSHRTASPAVFGDGR